MQVNCTASEDHRSAGATCSGKPFGLAIATARVTKGARRQKFNIITTPIKLGMLQLISAKAFFVQPLHNSEKFVYILTRYNGLPSQAVTEKPFSLVTLPIEMSSRI